ncbi:MAG TPA: hypothetical protein VN646_18535 [Candidatus Acidoferrum sp.]|nr:hypothetical protein [Candidatus Acidoferrum sp.]
MSTLDLGRRARPGRVGVRPPAIRVTIETGDPAADAALGVVSVKARVTGGRGPVRLYLYVNGDLADAWTEPEGYFDLSLDEYGPGRHAVTARGVDSLGRWAGASMVVACHGVESASNE